MIGMIVPRKDQHWELFLKLREIVGIVFAPAVTVSMAEYLKCLTEDHHQTFKAVYPDVSLIPKHHFVIHYPTAVLRTGPLGQYMDNAL
jgi:hypothetical protein